MLTIYHSLIQKTLITSSRNFIKARDSLYLHNYEDLGKTVIQTLIPFVMDYQMRILLSTIDSDLMQ